MATRKKAAAGKKSSGKGEAKVEKVMHEFKHHELRSGGGRKVTNPKQAIAIALSEAREAGADIPEKPRRSAAPAQRPHRARGGPTCRPHREHRRSHLPVLPLPRLEPPQAARHGRDSGHISFSRS